ncbi:MAG TPA: nucleotidyltransferase domain-containing protein [Longimicrobiaceae bacterium]|nr:nucleotidyltransferase domain-containing protein [Longimicrobiaceae bacterium]
MNVEIPRERIAEFCRRWKVREFSLFGSVLRDDFRPDSDIDVLVTFEDGVRPGLSDWLDMEDELRELFGRDVDLVKRDLVETNPNYIVRKHILGTARPVYVA